MERGSSYIGAEQWTGLRELLANFLRPREWHILLPLCTTIVRAPPRVVQFQTKQQQRSMKRREVATFEWGVPFPGEISIGLSSFENWLKRTDILERVARVHWTTSTSPDEEKSNKWL